MTDVLSMSLDDIINNNKGQSGRKKVDKESSRGRGSRGEKRPARAGGSEEKGSRKGSTKLLSDSLRVVVTNSGGIRKGGRGRGAREQVDFQQPQKHASSCPLHSRPQILQPFSTS